MSRRQRAYFSAVAGPFLLVSAFLTAGFALARLDPNPPQAPALVSSPAPPSVDQWPSPGAAPAGSWMRVNYAYDQVGANYEAGHTFWITVTDDVGTVKASGTAQSTSDGGWDGDGFESAVWTPEQPDIVPFDLVYFSADDGYANTIQVGEIRGTLDAEADSVGGPITATWFITLTLEVACHPWGAWEAGFDAPVKHSSAAPDGSVPFLCDWGAGGEWDIQPDQDVGVMYIESDDDRVIDVYREPGPPELRVAKWHLGGSARPGGVAVYGVHHANAGSGPAENTRIVDVLPVWTTYANDTSGLPVTIGASNVITWDPGTVDPGEQLDFAVTLDVAAGAPSGPAVIDANCLAIQTSSPGDPDPGNDSACAPPVDIWPDDVELSIDKWASPGDPAPGEEFDYTVEWCNHRGAAAGPVVLTDTLPAGVTLLGWQHPDPQEVLWSELSFDGSQLVLYAPGLPGDRCAQLALRLEVDAGVPISTTLANHVALAVADDVDPDNNWKTDTSAHVSPLRQDLRIIKRLQGSVLVPGGTANFSLAYENLGNVETSVRITDTMPPGLSYLGGHGPDGPLPDPTILGELLVWDLPPIPVNERRDYSLELGIDQQATPNPGLVNCATIAGDHPDADPGNDNSCFTFPVNPPGANLRVRKWHRWHGDGQLGYTVRFDNIGDQIVPAPVITDTLPAGTSWSGWWEPGFDPARFIGEGPLHVGNDLIWHLDELHPGETGRLNFNADLDEPGAPLRWYTNTVYITLPPGDTDPGDNSAESVAFSGGEVHRVELWLNPWGDSNLWGSAAASSPITVTTPQGQFNAWADPGCGGCWGIDNVGPLAPGDLVTVAAGQGEQPVAITIPDPFDVEASSTTDSVWGQVDHLDGEWLEVDLYDGPTLETQTDGAGNFVATFPDLPPAGQGEVRYPTQVDYSEVVFHRPFRALDLVLEINYGHDWVEGTYEPGHTVWITVTESDGVTVKGTAALETGFVPWWGGATGFSSNWSGWQGAPPDLLPGDWLFAAVDNGFTGQAQLGDIDFRVDYAADVITGTLSVPTLLDPVALRCEIWGHPEGPAVDGSTDPAGGQIFCDFGAAGWDIEPGWTAAVIYWEPDGDRVINTFDWPLIRASIGPESGGDRHVWGHQAEPNASVTVTVTDLVGAFVAGATAPTDGHGNWSTGNELPEGALATLHQIFVDFGDNIADGLTIYPMDGEADPATNVITITVSGQPFFSLDLEVCHPTSGCQWFGLGEIGPSGVVEADLLAEHGYDLEPGASLHAQLNVWHGHQLHYSWGLPVPELGVTKWHLGGSARPGGVAVYGVRHGNSGSGPAENTRIVDVLPVWTSYAGDTSGLPVTIGASNVITWDAGTVDPGEQLDFAVTLDVAAGAPTGPAVIDANCLAIQTSSQGDWNPDNDSSCAPPVDVWPDEVELGVDKWASPSDPAPGEEFDYIVEWCNHRGAAAGPVFFTDTLPAEVTLLEWRSSNPQESLWAELSFDGTELVLYAPGLPGERCEQLTLRVGLGPATPLGTTLVNQAEISAAGDVEPGNDSKTDTSAQAGTPLQDLAITKRLQGSVLVPGGTATFAFTYQNLGNVETSVRITDTMPVGLSYLGGEGADGPLPDPTILGNLLIWDLPALPVNQGRDFSIQLSIDELIQPDPGLVNCATIAGDYPDGNPDDNSSCTSFPVGEVGANLRIRKWHDWEGDWKLSYRVRFDNIGNEPVTGVLITDTLPNGTVWDGWWEPGFDPARFVGDPVHGGNQLTWQLDELHPGETGLLFFNADLEDPGTPLRWYTNTVQITLPPGEITPADNYAESVAFSGGEVQRVELWLDPWGDSNIWGDAVPSAPITVTTPQGQFNAWADPGCGGCWGIDTVGPLGPGDLVIVVAGQGEQPVAITVPDPFDVEASSTTDSVWGQVDHLDSEWLEVDLYDGPTLETQTDGAGNFAVTFADLPTAAEGEVRYSTQADYAEVVFHRYWRSPDLVLDINYGHDWVEGTYEPGHTVWITVTESDGVTVKGSTELETGLVPWWDGRTGFSSNWQGWQGEPPDLLPGDWLFAAVDNGFTGQAQLGDIDFRVDYAADVITGTLSVPTLVDPVALRCEIWGHPEGPVVEGMADPNGGQIFCDFGTAGWDIAPGQTAAVIYREPDGHQVINTFDWPLIRAAIGPDSGGDRYVWGHRAEPSASVTVTITDQVGGFLARATAPTDGQGNWSTDNDLPAGALAPWNQVLVDFGNSITDTLTVYPMAGEANPTTDVITITAAGPPFFSLDLEVCHPTNGCQWFGLGEIGANGVVTSNLQADFGVDIVPGTAFNAQLTVWNEHALFYSWRLPIPSIAIEKLTNGEDADTGPGPYVLVDQPVEWTYLVANTGQITLTDVVVVDDPPASVQCGQTILGSGEEMLCSASDLAQPGAYSNLATATGLPDGGGEPVSASDPSHYFGADPKVVLELWTNGLDADFPPGPYVLAGEPITRTYVISNTGNVTLTDVSVVDEPGGTVSCPGDTTPVGASLTCVVTATAVVGQYVSFAAVEATPPGGLGHVFDSDVSHYFGIAPAIELEKLTNGVDADAPPGVEILAGAPITWTYVITNTGNVTLTAVGLVDDQLGIVDCADTVLAAGASMTCSAGEPAVAGPYVNVATVTAQPPDGSTVEASDASHYFGVEPAIELEKLTNGVDADEPPGVEIVAGAPITWTYVITNTGNVTLTAVSLVDDRLGVVDCVNTTLAAGESMTCFASELAVAGPYVNVATATGQPPSGQQAEDTDSSHYFGIEPSIAIEKFTNGVDADLPPGVEIGVGEPITWTYVVTNTGSVELSEIAVVDDQGVDVTCPQTVLEVGESMTCSAGGVAGEGPYVNVGTASGQPPTGEPVSAADASHYLGGQILHADDFESGDTSAWDGRKPP